MSSGSLLSALLGFLVLGAVWIFLLRPDDTASRVLAARQRAEQVEAKGDLPWEDPRWREEFSWLEAEAQAAPFEGDGRIHSTLEAVASNAIGVVQEAGVAAEVTTGLLAEPEQAPTNWTLRLRGASGEVVANRPVAIQPLESDIHDGDFQFEFESGVSATDGAGQLKVFAPLGRYRATCGTGEAEFQVTSNGELIDLEIGAVVGG